MWPCIYFVGGHVDHKNYRGVKVTADGWIVHPLSSKQRWFLPAVVALSCVSLHRSEWITHDSNMCHTHTHTHTQREQTHTDWQRPFTITRKSNDISKERKEGVEFHRKKTTFLPSNNLLPVHEKFRCVFLPLTWVGRRRCTCDISSAICPVHYTNTRHCSRYSLRQRNNGGTVLLTIYSLE